MRQWDSRAVTDKGWREGDGGKDAEDYAPHVAQKPLE
jgi:hypothetical protein